MQAEDRKPFADLVADVMSVYGKPVSHFLLSMWWAACERYSLEQVRKALTSHIMDPERGHFAPKPADLVRVLDGSTTDRAALAWGKALDAAQRVGAYQDVVFDDPAIHATIEDLGGWTKFCRTEAKDLSYLQHRFTESYRAYCARGQYEYPRKLCGDRSPDEMYLKRGLPPPRPTLIGDPARARTVYHGGIEGSKTAISLADAAMEQVLSIAQPLNDRRHAA